MGPTVCEEEGPIPIENKSMRCRQQRTASITQPATLTKHADYRVVRLYQSRLGRCWRCESCESSCH